MMTRIAAALALVLGTAQAAEPVKPLPGETEASFQCRAAHIPEIRPCTAPCEGDAEARFECVQSCTDRGLWSMARCRDAGGATAAALASR